MKRLSLVFLSLSALTFLFAISAQANQTSAHILSGNVSDSSGTDISGAVVDVIDTNTSSSVGTDTTDGDGNFSLEVGTGTYDVEVMPPGGSGFGSIIALGQDITSDKVLNFVLTPAGSVTISGIIRGPLGNALENQTVTLNPGPNQVETFSDSDGFYSLEIGPGNHTLIFSGSGNPPTTNSPQSYFIRFNNFDLTQDTIFDIDLPANKVDIHVQDQNGTSVSGAEVKTDGPNNSTLVYNGITANDSWSPYHNNITTDSDGNATLWLFDTNPNGSGYNFTVTPPSGSPFEVITIGDVFVVGNQTEIISLQFIHEPPVTSAILSPAPNGQGEYSDPTTVTLSATAASGFTIANTYYTIDGGSQQTYTTPFEVTGDGEHTITFWSVDNAGVPEAENELIFTIVSNQPPIANAGSDQTVTEGDTVQLDGSGSTDPDGAGDIVSYSWTFGDGETGTSVSPTHIYEDNGVYEASLTVEDSSGETDTDTVTITVDNAPPVVGNISVSAAYLILGNPTNITADGSFTDAGVLDTHTASWNFGEGTAAGVVTESNGSGTVDGTFTYTQAGTYNVTLTVTDNDGDSGVSSNTITVEVVTPTGAIEDLVDLVEGFNLHQGIDNSLDAKLDSAINALDDLNENNDQAAINSLESFINAVEAQRGNKITNEQADALIAAAQAIIDSLSS